jgi:hypothetical protein
MCISIPKRRWCGSCEDQDVGSLPPEKYTAVGLDEWFACSIKVNRDAQTIQINGETVETYGHDVLDYWPVETPAISRPVLYCISWFFFLLRSRFGLAAPIPLFTSNI